MASSKSIPKVGRNRNAASFGGHNQPRSGTQSQDPAARFCTGHAGSNISESVLSPLSSLQDEEFPELGKVGASSSSATLNSANPKVVSHRGGSFSRVHTEGMPSTSSISHMPSTSSKSSTSSREVHHGAHQERERPIGAEEEDHSLHKVSFKNKRKGPIRKHAADVGEDENKTSASQDRIYFLGRLLTYILRHRASQLNLQVRNDGYVVVSDMLKLDVKTRPGIPLSAYTVDDVLKAVERDTKQRFTLFTENGVLLIRANQGHSIKTIESDKLLKPILSSDEIPVCVHGTLMSNLRLIMKTGLKKMGRNHVHFASGLPRENGVISGMRYTSEVLIYLDSKKALQDGMKIYMSDNGVVLTEGFDGVVPPEYFERIAKWDNGKITPLPLNAKA